MTRFFREYKINEDGEKQIAIVHCDSLDEAETDFYFDYEQHYNPDIGDELIWLGPIMTENDMKNEMERENEDTK